MTCSRGNCVRKARRKGLCYPHYNLVPRGYVDSGVVQEHIRKLRLMGYGWDRLAEATGMAMPVLVLKRERVQLDTAKRILAIPIPTAPVSSRNMIQGGATVPAIGTRRRLQALSRIGYTRVYLAGQLGMHQKNLSTRTAGNTVSAALAAKVADLFNRLQLTQGPSTSAISRAAKKGWAPPLAWDEDSIDNPDAEPQLPEGSKDAWFEDYQELRALGLNNNQIAERWDMKRESLYQRMRRILPRDEYERWIA